MKMTRKRFKITGIVQGVGFRPHVYAVATSLGLAGYVLNDTSGVVVEVEGPATDVAVFGARLLQDAPPLAIVEAVTEVDLDALGDSGFRIEASVGTSLEAAPVAPDVATCSACLSELFDPNNRRYRYPFINCTACGPRFTITRAVPYDRANTTMSRFEMCHQCRAEYEDPADRRFHAEPIACHSCGPQVTLIASDPVPRGSSAIRQAAALIGEGKIIAVKGLGGYHLACSATDHRVVATLRERKAREEKPFAVMVRDLDAAGALVSLDPDAQRQLGSRNAPIALAPRNGASSVAPNVAPGNRSLGVVLPYTPLHHLLLDELREPIVITSGNVSDEPLVYRDDEAVTRLGAIADTFLTHDRPIHIGCDDSVVRTGRGRSYPIRRSRGFAPAPMTVRATFDEPILGVGAELKNVFCLGIGGRAILSHHIGDLETWDAFRSFVDGIEHFQRVFRVAPRVIAHDLHPEYLSTKWALDRTDVLSAGVQHHHAHLASCLADNERSGPTIGVVLDGTGFGEDGTIWGGEVLLGDSVTCDRIFHLRPVPLPGGATAVREPWRMAAVYLDAIFGDDAVDVPLGVVIRNRGSWRTVVDMARGAVNAPIASSAGRLFDTVAALCGVRDKTTYEGQAAAELEQLADVASDRAYPSCFSDEVLDGHALVAAVAEDLLSGTPPSVVAAAFHNGLVRSLVDAASVAGARSGTRVVALSGGTFQNLLLLDRLSAALEGAGFEVLLHRRVPPNDGGISLGQVAIANARLREGLL